MNFDNNYLDTGDGVGLVSHSDGCGGGCEEKVRAFRLRMDVGVLSDGEKAYLLGLYLADGNLGRRSESTFRARFALQGNEEGIVERVVAMFRRSGLRPRVYRDRKKDFVVVSAVATNLVSLFPDKKSLKSMGDQGLSWIVSEGVEVPFIAGLLDGDGYVDALYDGRKSAFGSVSLRWTFFQSQFPFLVDFVSNFVNRLVSCGASVSGGGGDDGRVATIVNIRRSGRYALLREGIVRWSWKVVRCLRKYGKSKGRIAGFKARFLTIPEVARRLHRFKTTVWYWCRRGYVKYLLVMGIGRATMGKHYRYFIPVEEVERLQFGSLLTYGNTMAYHRNVR